MKIIVDWVLQLILYALFHLMTSIQNQNLNLVLMEFIKYRPSPIELIA